MKPNEQTGDNLIGLMELDDQRQLMITDDEMMVSWQKKLYSNFVIN